MKYAIFLFIAGCIGRAAGQLHCPEAYDLRIHECGAKPLRSLVAAGNDCMTATRLLEFARWLESVEKPCSTIVSDVGARYASFRDTAVFPIDYSGVSFIGRPEAPVKIIAYISMSCPLCKKLYREIADSLVSPGRSDRIAFGVKPFAATQLEQALVAARNWDRQPRLLLALAPVTERITMNIVLKAADSIGIPAADFKRRIEDNQVAAQVAASRAEAIGNGVTVTPTFFINGKRYAGYKNSRWVVDAAEHEAQSAAGVSRK